MEDISKTEWMKQTLLRTRVDISKVINQLSVSSESGSLPGNKVEWCINKLILSEENLNLIGEALDVDA